MTSTHREEKRETLRQSAISVWNDYCSNGMHATLWEVDDWLSKLEANRNIEPPECHT